MGNTGELINYIQLLMMLDKQGFACKKEIQDALKALHYAMGFKNE